MRLVTKKLQTIIMACEHFRRVLMELRQEILDEYHISHIHFQSFSSVEEDQKVPNNIYCCDATKNSFSR